MSVDLVHPAVEKTVLVFEGIGDGKVRVNSASLDHPFVILAGEALEIVGTEKKIMMGRVGRSALLARPRSEWTGRGGLRSDDEVTAFLRLNNFM